MVDILGNIQIGGGNRFFIDTLCEHYGYTRSIQPVRYWIGGSPRMFEFFDGAIIAVCHWMGSDVLRLRDNPRFLAQLKDEWSEIRHWFNGYDLSLEAVEIGIMGHTCRLPPRHWYDEPIPLGDAVSVYAPKINLEMYHLSLMHECERLSDREWIYIGNDPQRLEYGQRDPGVDDAIRRSRALVRVTSHDGFSFMSQEYMLAGRVVVTNQSRPYQYQIRHNPREILRAIEREPYPDAPAYYRLARDQSIDMWRAILGS